MDWVAGLVRVRRNYTRGQFGTPKSRRSSRAVPMADRVGAELHDHLTRSRHMSVTDLVFAHPELGTVLDPSKLRKRFQAAVRRAGLRPLRLHDLRHSFGTSMASAGAPMRAVQHWMGHRSSQTTEIYAHYSPDQAHGGLWAQKAFGKTEDPAPNASGGQKTARPVAASIH